MLFAVADAARAARTDHSFLQYFVLATACYLAVSSVFRLIGSVCKNYDQCNRYAVLATTFFELLSGYLISLPDQRRYIFWLTYLNPMFVSNWVARNSRWRLTTTYSTASQAR